MFDPSSSLKKAFFANAVFSVLCAVPMMLIGTQLHRFTGIDSLVLFRVGLVVGINALLLAAYSYLERIPKLLARIAVAGDALWVLLSALVLLTVPVLTFWGQMLVLDVALIVGILGAIQYYYLERRGLS
jgi:hypothetical protein